MTTDSFVDLVRRVRGGDPDAATELVRLHEPEVHRFVRFRLTDPSLRRLLDSVDVCQSVFAQLFVGLANGRWDVTTPRQLVRLLQTMASNKLRDHHRRQVTARRGGPTSPVTGEALEAAIDHRPGPADTAASNDLVATVRGRLSDEERAWLDRWLAGYGWDEIADTLGGNANVIRKRFARALDRAARELDWEGRP